MIPVFFGLLALMFLTQALFIRREERKAREFVANLHGDLPPPASFHGKGYSAIFLAELMRAYIDADFCEDCAEERTKKAKEEELMAGCLKLMPAATPIDWRKECDCPECANGVEHEVCRSGWQAVLRGYKEVLEAQKAAHEKLEADKALLRENGIDPIDHGPVMDAMDLDGYPDVFAGELREAKKKIRLTKERDAARHELSAANSTINDMIDYVRARLFGWVPPCTVCGGNCGQCAESHCAICGVKPRDGECDQKKHAIYNRLFPNGRT